MYGTTQPVDIEEKARSPTTDIVTYTFLHVLSYMYILTLHSYVYIDSVTDCRKYPRFEGYDKHRIWINRPGYVSIWLLLRTRS